MFSRTPGSTVDNFSGAVPSLCMIIRQVIVAHPLAPDPLDDDVAVVEVDLEWLQTQNEECHTESKFMNKTTGSKQILMLIYMYTFMNVCDQYIAVYKPFFPAFI